MVQLKLLVFTLTLYELIVDLDAKTCLKGQRVTRDGRDGCEVCPDNNYQPEENNTKYCKACTKCDDKRGSSVKENCTKETNTKCQCHTGFDPSESDSSTCKCKIGFGVNPERTKCSECEEGYFSARINSPCQKWKECKSGVNVTGTKTSDVICNPELKTFITTPPTTKKIVSLITRLTTSHRPHGGAQTERMHTTTTLTAPRHTTTSQPFHPNTGNYIGTGMALIIFGIIGLLILTIVTCKLHITPRPAAPKNDSLCRRPVEESGDGSLSSLKLNPEEL